MSSSYQLGYKDGSADATDRERAEYRETLAALRERLDAAEAKLARIRELVETVGDEPSQWIDGEPLIAARWIRTILESRDGMNPSMPHPPFPPFDPGPGWQEIDPIVAATVPTSVPLMKYRVLGQPYRYWIKP